MGAPVEVGSQDIHPSPLEKDDGPLSGQLPVSTNQGSVIHLKQRAGVSPLPWIIQPLIQATISLRMREDGPDPGSHQPSESWNSGRGHGERSGSGTSNITS